MRVSNKQLMASGVRSSSKHSRGFFVQMHNASSSDLLWGGKSFKRIKRNVSSHYFAVERLISKRSSGKTVSSVFGFNNFYCGLSGIAIAILLFVNTCTYAYNISFLDTVFGKMARLQRI